MFLAKRCGVVFQSALPEIMNISVYHQQPAMASEKLKRISSSVPDVAKNSILEGLDLF